MNRSVLGILVLAVGALTGVALAGPLLLQSTTSTQNSGLYDAILPQYTKETGGVVRVVAVGTGQAIRNAERCDADVLLVHAKDDELAFVAAGFGTARLDVMYNDFVIVGPRANPASLQSGQTVVEGLQAIYHQQAPFASRGDDSGTHKKERALWLLAGTDPSKHSGQWYLETGTGMGATLNIAVESNAYALTDRATWINFGNKMAHEILLEGDPVLFNQYGIIAIDPEHCPHVDQDGAARFVEWITGPAGQAAIADYRVDGQQLFFPNAGD
ncbi:MAG: substrate-binding domain-containing protein [Pseudomonadota bacterium]